MYNPISTETFERHTNYSWYDYFQEERMSFIDEDKNITVHEDFVNLSSEDNSQFIPFVMDRFYQGVDLTTMDLEIYFVNSQQGANHSRPVNVEYSEYRIRFGWLLDQNATYVAGPLTFEIRAIGSHPVDSDGNKMRYVWKTRSNKQINIEKALSGNEDFEPTQDWYIELVQVIAQKDDAARESMNAAAASEQAAMNSQTAAKLSENNAKVSETNAAASERNADISEANALTSANNSADSAKLAQSWAVGGVGVRADEGINNAKYWCEQTNAMLPQVREDISFLEASLDSEITRSKGEESTLTNAINNEITRATGAEDTLRSNLATEVSRATNAETALSNRIDSMGRDLTTEVSRSIDAETVLSDRIDSLSRDLTAEVTRSTNAETTLTTNLNSETTRAEGAEHALDVRVTANETKLSTLIATDANKSVRQIANEELAAQLVAENSPANMDTLQEISAWIATHPDDASAMNQQIQENTADIGVNTIAIAAMNDEVDTIISSLTAKADSATMVTELTKKADVDKVNEQISLLNIEVSNKLDISEFNNVMSNKADSSTVVALSNTVAALGSTVSSKANTTDVETVLADKSNIDHTHTFFHVGTEAPEDTSILWIDTVNGLKYYDGAGWVNIPVSSNNI